MSITQTHPLPSTGNLLKATFAAACIGASVLITIVLPAEYGVDPTGIGRLLGLDTLAKTSVSAVPSQLVPSEEKTSNVMLAAKAEAAFGKNAGRALDATAVSFGGGALNKSTFTVSLAPGKGAEVKTHLKTGEGLVFRWRATGDVAVDMHGERLSESGKWTSYSVEPVQREAVGTFVAPFEGSHGWYWENRGTQSVKVDIEVSGFQSELYRP